MNNNKVRLAKKRQKTVIILTDSLGAALHFIGTISFDKEESSLPPLFLSFFFSFSNS